MSDLDKQKLSLTTIAFCLVFICGMVFWATQSYDGILSHQKSTDDKMDQLIEGQKDTHAWLVSLSSRLDQHEHQIAALQESVDANSDRNSATSARDKKFEDDSK